MKYIVSRFSQQFKHPQCLDKNLKQIGRQHAHGTIEKLFNEIKFPFTCIDTGLKDPDGYPIVYIGETGQEVSLYFFKYKRAPIV